MGWTSDLILSRSNLRKAKKMALKMYSKRLIFRQIRLILAQNGLPDKGREEWRFDS